MNSRITRRRALTYPIAAALTNSTAALANSPTAPPGLANALAAARAKPFGLAAKAASSERLFGTSLNVWNMNDSDYMTLIAQQSSILVAENALGAHETRTSPAGFDFKNAEIVSAFAEQNKTAFRGHTLIWDRLVPPWVLKEITTPAKARDEFFLEVQQPCLHFKGRMHSWDVVNEVLSWEDGQPFGLKRGYWLQMLGPDYVDMSFLAARQADPDALLCFNLADVEYDHPWFEKNRQTLLIFVKRMRANNVPIDVIGIESHLKYAGVPKFPFSPSVFQRFLSEIADLGLRVIISELDVPDRHLPADFVTRDRDVAYCSGQLVAASVGHPAVIAIICWGLTDRYAWMNSDPSFARTDGLPSRGMLFNDDLKPKLAYNAVAMAFDQAAPL